MRNRMKHIVFVLGSYYPNYSAVGKCLGNIADELGAQYKITVICMKNKLNQDDRAYYNAQKIVRVTTDNQHKRLQLEQKIQNTKGSQFLKAKKQILRLKGFIKTLLAKETIDAKLVAAYLEAINGVDEFIDVIIPTCNPFESVVTAMKYKDKHPDVEIIPYLFDLFAENLNLNRFFLNRELKRKNNMRLENEMFEKSKAVLHVANWTSYIKKYYGKYSEKTIEVEHPLLLKQKGQESIKKDDRIHVVYTGIVDIKNRNPNHALQVLTKLESEKIVIDFYSFGSGEEVIEQYAERYSNRVVAHGKVSSNEAGIARIASNILLSIGNIDTSQIPSKLFEYMSAGKPILHFAYSESDPTIKILNNYPVKMIVMRNQKVDMEMLEYFILKNSQTNISFDEIFKNYSSASPEIIAQIFKHIILENESKETRGGGMI